MGFLLGSISERSSPVFAHCRQRLSCQLDALRPASMRHVREEPEISVVERKPLQSYKASLAPKVRAGRSRAKHQGTQELWLSPNGNCCADECRSADISANDVAAQPHRRGTVATGFYAR